MTNLVANVDGRTYRIEEDYPEVGAYLYVYEKDLCVYDYLQDNIQMCKDFVMETFNVPLTAWVEENRKHEN